MTIAVCYLSPEGVVLGADSTSSVVGSKTGFHYFNNNQKLYEIGEYSTIGIVTWGLGATGNKSHRTLIAQLSDKITTSKPKNMAAIAKLWTTLFWQEYSKSPHLLLSIQRCKSLDKKLPFDPSASAPDPAARTEAEENEYQLLKQTLFVGFCIAGYWPPDRTSKAYTIQFDPLGKKPKPVENITPNYCQFFGVPNLFMRLISGADPGVKNAIINSGKWRGTPVELDDILGKFRLDHPSLPIRDAIDYVHSCIYSTIKSMKFSSLSQVCGGPIEIAVITTDRKFRWVRHKDWDSAVLEGAI